MRDSVELQKTKIINQKLKKAVKEKHAEIRKLERKLQQYQSSAGVSLVSANENENEKINLNFFIQSIQFNFIYRKPLKY